MFLDNTLMAVKDDRIKFRVTITFWAAADPRRKMPSR
jgi:hypothetical protein